MEIKIQKKGYVLCISIGRKTDWYSQLSYIAIVKEYYENMELVWASMVYDFWRKK
jgi:hypothetical protein